MPPPQTGAPGQCSGRGRVPDAPTCCGRSACAPRTPCAGCAAAAPSAPPPGGVPACGPPRSGATGAPLHFLGCAAASWLQRQPPAKPRLHGPFVGPSLPRAVPAPLGGLWAEEVGVLSPVGRQGNGGLGGRGTCPRGQRWAPCAEPGLSTSPRAPQLSEQSPLCWESGSSCNPDLARCVTRGKALPSLGSASHVIDLGDVL